LFVSTFQEYSVQITFRQKWTDERLSYDQRLSHGDMRGEKHFHVKQKLKTTVLIHIHIARFIRYNLTEIKKKWVLKGYPLHIHFLKKLSGPQFKIVIKVTF
jgi:hypothetical protein